MPKTKATEVAKQAKKASVAQLSELAKKFIRDKSGKEPEAPAGSVPPTAPPAGSVQPAPEVPVKKEKLEISEADLLEANGFDPKGLPFCLQWCNIGKFRRMFHLDEQEACTILLSMVGPTPEGEDVWSKYDFPEYMFDKDGYLEPKNAKFKDTDSAPEPKAYPKSKAKQVRSKAAAGPPAKARKLAPPVDTRNEPDASMDDQSSEDEDLQSGTGSSNGPPAPPAPPTVMDPKDFEDCQDDGAEEVVNAPGLPEPVKESIDANALDAKHALKEAMSTPLQTPHQVFRPNLVNSVSLSCSLILPCFNPMHCFPHGIFLLPQGEKTDAEPKSAKLGPSASNVVTESDQLLAALTLLKDGFGDPDLKAIFKGKKIDTIISKNQPIYDEDAPDCPESVRFLVFTGGSCVDREKVAITASSAVNVRSTPEMVGSLVEPTATLPGSSAAASGAARVGGAGQLSLSSLVGVVNDCKDDNKEDKKEKKAVKKDKKDKKVKKEDPSTTKEKQQNGCKELKKEMSNCNILYDLPPENALRKELSKMKAKLEEFADKFLDLE
eukprot:s674_g1.t1